VSSIASSVFGVNKVNSAEAIRKRSRGFWRCFQAGVVTLRQELVPEDACCTHSSRFPVPERSDAYATSLPSAEIAGSVVRPGSDVIGSNV
jgi:hypothetical protein